MTRAMDDEIDICDPLRASLTKDDSVRFCTMEKVKSRYIRSERDLLVAEGLNELVKRAISRAGAGLPAERAFRPEGRALVVVGQSGAGKTTTLSRAFHNHPAFSNFGNPDCPLISVRVPKPSSLKDVGILLLVELGFPMSADRKLRIVWAKVRERLELLNVRIIHMDEIQNITSTANVIEVDLINDTIKSLLNDTRYPVCLVLSGLPEIAPFLSKDRQIGRRCQFIAFQQIGPNDFDSMSRALIGLAKTADLEVSPNTTHDLIPRLAHAALYQMGIAIEIMQDAIDQTLKTKKSIVTIEEFATAYAQRNFCMAAENPFLARNWAEIDCAKKLGGREVDLGIVQIIAGGAPEEPAKPVRRYKTVKRKG